MAEKFQLRGHTLEVWLRKNPIIADRELVIIPDENTFVIGNGKDKFSLLTRRPFGADAWEVLVKYGGYTGTREDFCRQLSDVMRMPEQQAGTLTNAGAGWNSFTFPREFVEECYVMLTVQDADCRAAVRNTTKQGFHYILHDASGNTTSSAILVNWMATAVSELNMAQAIAKLAGLDPFAYDDLTTLFKTHASEVVANEAAFGMVKRSAMASARYLCFLCDLSHDSFYNMVSIAESVPAMNAVSANEAAVAFVNNAPGAFDSIRLNSMAMGKYLAGLSGMSPVNYSTVTDLLNDTVALTALVADQTAMVALCASEVASAETATHETACSAVAGSDIAMQAVAGSDIAYNVIYNNSEAFATLLSIGAAVSIIANDRAAVEAMIDTEERCILVAASATAMDALAASAVARAAVKENEDAWKVVTETDAFVTKYAIGCLENATYKPSNFANMAAIASNSGAVTALSASQIAMTALSASRIARNAILNNSVSWKVVTDSNSFIAKYAIGCLESSSYKPENFANMSAIVSNSAALAALASSSTAMSALASSSVVIKVPKLTANDSRVLASTSPIYSNRYGWYAFDGSVGTSQSTGFVYGSGTTANNAYVGYCFDQIVGCMYFDLAGSTDNSGIQPPKSFKIQCSDNGSSWTDVESFTIEKSTGVMNRIFMKKSQGRHRYWRILVTEGFNASYCGISELQFYCF